MPIGDYFTVAEAADVLGVKPVSIHSAIKRGALVAEKKGPRLVVIGRDELDRYVREHKGGQGWDKRKAPNYTPSKMAQWAKDYRQRQTTRGPEEKPTIAQGTEG